MPIASKIRRHETQAPTIARPRVLLCDRIGTATHHVDEQLTLDTDEARSGRMTADERDNGFASARRKQTYLFAPRTGDGSGPDLGVAAE